MTKPKASAPATKRARVAKKVAAPAKKAGKAAGSIPGPRSTPPPPAPPQRRPKADWEAIERDYRTGTFSDQELADKHHNVVTRQAISKRAKEKGWTKDLTAAVRHATRAKVIEQEVAARVANKVATDVAGNVAESCQATVDTVMVAATLASDVIMRHRKDITAFRDLSLDMLHELKLATHSPDELEGLFRLATEGLDADSLIAVQQSFRDMLKLHSRVASLHKLVETANKLQPLERKAFALDEEGDKDPSGGRTLGDVERATRLAALLTKARERQAAEGSDG